MKCGKSREESIPRAEVLVLRVMAEQIEEEKGPLVGINIAFAPA